ncbi:MAG: hypothetical protein JXQ99_02870 [Hyphomicrobiaceae bacterium]
MHIDVHKVLIDTANRYEITLGKGAMTYLARANELDDLVEIAKIRDEMVNEIAAHEHREECKLSRALLWYGVTDFLSKYKEAIGAAALIISLPIGLFALRTIPIWLPKVFD